MHSKYLIVFLLLLFTNLLNAQLVTDRPDQTESAATVNKGSLQLESGFMLGFEEVNAITTRQILSPTTLFRYGLMHGMEIRVVNQFEMLKTPTESFQGISDTELGVKFEILNKPGINTQIAFLTHVIVPTGSADLTGDMVESVNKIAISHNIKDNVGLGCNLGYSYFGQGPGDLTYSLVLGIGINDRAGIYVETYGEIAAFADLMINADAGLTYLIRDNFQLDLSFGTGANHKMNFLATGISWLIMQ